MTYEPDKDPPFAPRETLLAWQEKNHPWLELSDVHRETTENVRVTVIPFYMGCRLSQNNVYWVCFQYALFCLIYSRIFLSGDTVFESKI